jgi:hypothetical protein
MEACRAQSRRPNRPRLYRGLWWIAEDTEHEPPSHIEGSASRLSSSLLAKLLPISWPASSNPRGSCVHTRQSVKGEDEPGHRDGFPPLGGAGQSRSCLGAQPRLIPRDGQHRSTDHPCAAKAATAEIAPRERGDAPLLLGAPGVFVEEVSYRSKAIDGVATTGVGAFVFGFFLGLFALALDRACRRRRFPPF